MVHCPSSGGEPAVRRTWPGGEPGVPVWAGGAGCWTTCAVLSWQPSPRTVAQRSKKRKSPCLIHTPLVRSEFHPSESPRKAKTLPERCGRLGGGCAAAHDVGARRHVGEDEAQGLDVDRLHEVLVEAALEGLVAVALAAEGGHRDDEDGVAAGGGAELLRHLEAVHPRQAEV